MKLIHACYSIEHLLEWDDIRLTKFFVDQSGTRHDGEMVRDWLLQLWLDGKKVIRKFPKYEADWGWHACVGWSDITGCPGHGGIIAPWLCWKYQREMLWMDQPTVTTEVRSEVPMSKPGIWKARSITWWEARPIIKGKVRRYCIGCGLRTWSVGALCMQCRGGNYRIPHKRWKNKRFSPIWKYYKITKP